MSCEVYTVSLKATGKKVIAAMTEAVFLKVATPKIGKVSSESDLDIGTSEEVKAMIDAINA